MFSYKKQFITGEKSVLENLKLEPFYISGLYLNSKKIISNYENNYVDRQSGEKINVSTYSGFNLSEYTVGTSLNGSYKKVFGKKIIDDSNLIPYENYSKEIYNSIFSGYEPNVYEKNNFYLPGVYKKIINTNGNSNAKYFAKKYKIQKIKNRQNVFLPKSGEKHILLFDVNFYGSSGSLLKECDQEMNVYVLDETDFIDTIKNPSIINLSIEDLNAQATGIINDASDLIRQKNLLDKFQIENNLVTDLSFGASQYNTGFNTIKMDINIKSPSKYCPKNIGQFYLFEYDGIRNPNDLQNYKLLVQKSNVIISEGKYVSGQKTGFMVNLDPGSYTLILSGLEKESGYIYN